MESRESFSHQLDLLESKIRHLKMGLFLIGSCLCLLFVSGAGFLPSVQRAERYEVLDGSGQLRGIFGVYDEGVMIRLLDDSGREKVKIVENGDEVGMFLNDSLGVVRVGVAQFAHGGGGIALHGPQSKGAAVLYYKDSGTLTFYEKDGTARLKIPERRGE